MNSIEYIICWLLMVHPPINVVGDFLPTHTLANLKTNAPDNTSELTMSRELLRGNFDPKKCDFELDDPIPDCCQAKQCPLSMKNPTSYKRKSRRYHSNKKEIKYDYFHGEGVLSCKMQIKPNDHCCLFEHRCYRHPYTGYVYFKNLKTDKLTDPHENDLSTTLKRKKTKTVPDKYDWSTTSKRKRTKEVTYENDWSTTSKRKRTKEVTYGNDWSTTSKRKRTKKVTNGNDWATTSKRKRSKTSPATTRKPKTTKKRKEKSLNPIQIFWNDLVSKFNETYGKK